MHERLRDRLHKSQTKSLNPVFLQDYSNVCYMVMFYLKLYQKKINSVINTKLFK